MLKSLMKLALLALWAAASSICFAEEDGLDLFLKAIENQQKGAAILSGKGSFEMTKGFGVKTEEEIQAEIDRKIAQYKEDMAGDPGLDQLIERVPQAVREQYGKTQKFSGSFHFDNSKEDYLYFEIQLIFSGGADKPVTTIEKRSKDPKSPKTVNVLLDVGASQTFIGDSPYDYMDFSQFGRVRGGMARFVDAIAADKETKDVKSKFKTLLTAIGGNKENTKILEIAETKPFDNGSTAYTLESSVDGKVFQRCVIVPERGYVCPLIETYIPTTGNPLETYVSNDFIEVSGIYYPTNCVEKKFDVTTGKLTEETSYKIDKETITLNEEESPKAFSIDVPEGCSVADCRDGKTESYRATAQGSLSLDEGGLDLKKASWLGKPGEIQKKSDDPAAAQAAGDRKRGLVARFVLSAIGLVIVVWVFIRRRNGEKG